MLHEGRNGIWTIKPTPYSDKQVITSIVIMSLDEMLGSVDQGKSVNARISK